MFKTIIKQPFTKLIMLTPIICSNKSFADYDKEKIKNYINPCNQLAGFKLKTIFPDFIPIKVIKTSEKFYKKGLIIDLRYPDNKNFIVKTDFIDISDVKNKIYKDENCSIVLFKIPDEATIEFGKYGCETNYLEVVDIKKIYNIYGLKSMMSLNDDNNDNNDSLKNCVKMLFEKDDNVKKEMFSKLSDNGKIMYCCIEPLFVKSIENLDEGILCNLNYQLKFTDKYL